jgi:hypothetical protein
VEVKERAMSWRATVDAPRMATWSSMRRGSSLGAGTGVEEEEEEEGEGAGEGLG